MFDRVQFKNDAKAALKGNWGKVFLLMFLCGLINLVISSIFEVMTGSSVVIYDLLGFLLGVFVLYPLAVGSYNIYLLVARSKQFGLKDIFYAFGSRYTVFITHGFMKGLKIFLWSLLLIVPGIIKSFEYMFTERILIDNPNMSSKEAFIKSREMTNGHKMDLFVLGLSFVLWFFLYMFSVFFFTIIWGGIVGAFLSVSGSSIIVILILSVILGSIIGAMGIPLIIYVDSTCTAAYLQMKDEDEKNSEYVFVN